MKISFSLLFNKYFHFVFQLRELKLDYYFKFITISYYFIDFVLCTDSNELTDDSQFMEY